ncbi:polysaccharide pyruvyl transferase family protein [Vulcanococcus limneticus Candia 3F8]|uniref:polysaccharide pyruvyl transferase family protein n=1 Tax=Vulcanococcus limneticus TaxID=2170428 RepID=UPI000B9869F6|nr:polysaccharide pyruvyl transferase family protein [Vulcanococcus limneticus]MCP9791133.1 polysaccharide pyruvyl transferase family protein [Vulcanococcus limneticus MW73D5]MCP9893717.1 polysaccharide pyruvyl transferase family protein [Vulcanococcus limneticus Candia 3F8]MCP9896531.1 polysaccharide pyruvyl transferase family protein [Vulcanococcus limneticus Candia 3B3]
MSHKLLSVSKFPNISGVNIGDYIQALASAQFISRLDGFIDRDEELKDYDGIPCNVIMNGWYMHSPKNWPPSELINPLFLSFHINSGASKELLSASSIAYLKSHQPIGCRDLNTLELLMGNGVEAYFSGCLTLTLGEKYRSSTRGNKTYIVDPCISREPNWVDLFKGISIIATHPFDILRLYLNKNLRLHCGRNCIKKLLKTALYYNEYSKVFGRKLIMKSTYVSHEGMFYKTRFKTDLNRLEEAERLVRLYAEASFVITSRIHCALPCLGLETPVIYLEKGQDAEVSKCRLAGLKELFNVVRVVNGVLVPQFETALPITVFNHPPNKDSWRDLANNLKHRCRSFAKNVKV